MASADQMKALLQSHADGDDDRFYAVAMQVAAHEARLGHGKLAKELRDLIDAAKASRRLVPNWSLDSFDDEFSSVLRWSYPKARLSDLIVGDQLAKQIWRVIREHRQAGRILEHGLSPRRKLLFIGPRGSGKGFSASVLAGELGLPLLRVRFDELLTKFKDDTRARLQKIFHSTVGTRGVYFFARVNVRGTSQQPVNEIGDKDEVLNSFLTLIKGDDSHSIIVASTSHPDTLDGALVGCFDDVLVYEFPNEQQIAELLRTRLRHVAVEGTDWRGLAGMAAGLSYSEVSGAANDALKGALLSGLEKVSDSDIISMLTERKAVSNRINAYRNPSG